MPGMRVLGLCALIAIFASACSSSSHTRCDQGATQQCTGPGGCDGVQTCGADGTLGACQCAAADGGNGSGTGDPGDFTRVDDASGHCYRLIAAEDRWSDNECVIWGGHLAAITSSDEHVFVSKMMDDAVAGPHPEVQGAWIGGYAESGAWVWVDGEPFDFTAWDVNAITTPDAGRDILLRGDTHWQWSSYNGNDAIWSMLCER
jgi:hypothetical protein